MLFLKSSALLSILAFISIPNESSAQFVEIVGSGFCRDSEGKFYARGEAEKFDDPQACLDNCLLLDDSDLVGIAYKYSNKRCHCNYNIGSEVIATCDRSVFTNGCRSNGGYTGSGLVSGTSGPPSWNCYAYESSPTFTPFAYSPSSPESIDFDGGRILQTPSPAATPVVVVTPPVSEQPTPKGTKKSSGGKHKEKRNLQTSNPIVIETNAPISLPKGTKKGTGGKNKGKRSLQTSIPVAIETNVPISLQKWTKKGSGSKEKKGKRNLQTSNPVVIETNSPVSLPKWTKKGSGSKEKKGKRNLQTSNPVVIETNVPVSLPKWTKKGSGSKDKKGKRNLQTSSPVTGNPVAIETFFPVPPKKGTKKNGGKKKQN